MTLEDRFAILDMIGSYSNAWDTQDADAWIACFTEDGAMDTCVTGDPTPSGTALGHASLRKVAAGSFARRLANVQTRHYQTNSVFLSLGEDEARTRTMVLVTQLAPGDPTPRITITGTYEDLWVRTAAGWRIKRRTLYVDRKEAPGA
jgi:hypothetical protein